MVVEKRDQFSIGQALRTVIETAVYQMGVTAKNGLIVFVVIWYCRWGSNWSTLSRWWPFQPIPTIYLCYYRLNHNEMWGILSIINRIVGSIQCVNWYVRFYWYAAHLASWGSLMDPHGPHGVGPQQPLVLSPYWPQNHPNFTPISYFLASKRPL